MVRFCCQKNETSEEKVFRNSCSYGKLQYSNGKYYTTMKGNTLRKDFEKSVFILFCKTVPLNSLSCKNNRQTYLFILYHSFI